MGKDPGAPALARAGGLQPPSGCFATGVTPHQTRLLAMQEVQTKIKRPLGWVSGRQVSPLHRGSVHCARGSHISNTASVLLLGVIHVRGTLTHTKKQAVTQQSTQEGQWAEGARGASFRETGDGAAKGPLEVQGPVVPDPLSTPGLDPRCWEFTEGSRASSEQLDLLSA